MLERLKEKAEDAIDKGRATARVYVPSKKSFLGGLKEYVSYDLRLSYWIIGGLVLLGAAVSIWVPHGWAIWPAICVAGFLSMVNEAADRNGQGVPPFQVYASLVGLVVGWIVITLVFSMFNPIVLLIGAVALGYQCARAWVQERERNRLIEARRASGECVHCGQVVTNRNGVCEHCGNEPDPIGTRLRRVANIVNANKDASRARAAIAQPSTYQSASSKEQALIAKAHFRQGRQRPGNRAK
jgi:hypothetical protein